MTCFSLNRNISSSSPDIPAILSSTGNFERPSLGLLEISSPMKVMSPKCFAERAMRLPSNMFESSISSTPASWRWLMFSGSSTSAVIWISGLSFFTLRAVSTVLASPSQSLSPPLIASRMAAAAAILLAISGGESDCEGDARTVLTALSVKKLNPDIQMTAEVLEPENISHLQLAGVDEILDSNMLLGNLMARSAKHFGLITFIGELISSKPSEGLSKLPVDDKMAGMSGDELEMFLLSEKHVMPLVASSDKGLERYSKGMKLEAGGFLLVLSSTSSEGSG